MRRILTNRTFHSPTTGGAESVERKFGTGNDLTDSRRTLCSRIQGVRWVGALSDSDVLPS